MVHVRPDDVVADALRDSDAAYAELFGWYLGDGHIVHEKRGVYGLHIYNDTKYVALNDHVKELMWRVKPGGKPHTRLMRGCTNTTVSWKHWPCLFPQHGPGRKDQRTLTMTSWQWEIIEAQPADFLRGLFHSDGCRANNWTQKIIGGSLNLDPPMGRGSDRVIRLARG